MGDARLGEPQNKAMGVRTFPAPNRTHDYHLAYAPDGSSFAVGGDDGVVRVYDPATGRVVQSFVNGGWVTALAFSPDGKSILSAEDDKGLHMWESATGRDRFRPGGLPGSKFSSARFTDDGRRIVTGVDGIVRIWDASTGAPVRSIADASSGAFCIMPRGRHVAVTVRTAAGHDVRLIDMDTGTVVWSVKDAGSSAPIALWRTPDPTRIVVAHKDGLVVFREPGDGREVRLLTLESPSLEFNPNAALSPDGLRLLSLHSDRTARLWDLATGATLFQFNLNDSGWTGAPQFSPDGRFAIASAFRKAVHIFKLPERVQPLREYAPLVRNLAGKFDDIVVGGGGRYLLLPMKDAGQLAVFDANAGDIVTTISLPSHEAFVAAGAKKFLVAYPDQKLLHRWDFETLTREVSNATLPVGGRLNALAMGSDSEGPALAAWLPDTTSPDIIPSRFSFIDLESLKVLRVGQITTGGMQGLAATSSSGGSFILHPTIRDKAHVRVSAGGGLFGFGEAQGLPFGYLTLSVRGNNLKAIHNNATVGHLAPGPDGRTVFTGRLGRLDAAGRPVGPTGTMPSNTIVTTLPTPDPSYFLALERSADPSQPVRASVHVAGSGDRLATIHGLDEMNGLPMDESWIRDNFTLEKRFHFLPTARLLVTVPMSNDRLVLRRLDLDQALRDLPGDYLFVVSPPVLTADDGQPLVHQLEARSRKGGIRYTLSRGPDGLVVSPEGKVSWPSPRRRPQGEELTAVVIVGDASGREVFHTLILRVN